MLDTKTITEHVWLAPDGEFVRESDVRQITGLTEGQNLPKRCKRLIGEAPMVEGAPPHCSKQALYQFYEVLKFSSACVLLTEEEMAQMRVPQQRDPEPINNRTIIRELHNLGKYVNPRCWPAVEFLVDGLQEYDLEQIKPQAQAVGRRWCHLLSLNGDESDLHWFAEKIGLQRRWFQPQRLMWHYDLTPRMRQRAVAAGAREVDRSDLRQVYLARKGRLTR